MLEAPVTVYNFEVEDFHTYYVGDGVLVHNSCAHKKSSWRRTKSNYWKDAAANKKTSAYYDLTDDNLALMAKGKAPFGIDGKRVELHHVQGISNSMDDLYALSKTAHTEFHKMYGYKNFIDITKTKFYRP